MVEIVDPVSFSQLFAEKSLSMGKLVIHTVLSLSRAERLSDLQNTFFNSFLKSSTMFSKRLSDDFTLWIPIQPSSLDYSYHFKEIQGSCNSKILLTQLLNEGISLIRPPWQVITIPDLNLLIFRFHHSLSDGASLIRAFLKAKTSPRIFSEAFIWDYNLASNFADNRIVENDSKPYFLAIMSQLLFFLLSLVRVALFADDFSSFLRTNCVIRPSVDFMELDISVANIKRYCRKHGCSLNDVLITAIATSLKNQCSYREIISAIWMDLSNAGDSNLINLSGNKALGVAFLKLPVTTSSKLILDKVHKEMRFLKESRSLIQKLLISLKYFYTPRFTLLYRFLIFLVGSYARISVSNLKGLTDIAAFSRMTRLTFIESINVITPPLMSMDLMINFLTYQDRISLGVCGMNPDSAKTCCNSIAKKINSYLKCITLESRLSKGDKNDLPE